MLIDAQGRAVTSLRMSLTARCNLRCTYCLPARGGPASCAPPELDFDSLVRTARAAAALGIRNLRLTGGEPLLRAGLPELIQRLKTETGIGEIALTTNGVLLKRHAEALAQSGLDRLTVSVDSLDPERFHAITRGGALDTVWEGIGAVIATGRLPVRINVLVQRGVNDTEFDRWIALVQDRALTVRFLELMPIGETTRLEWRARFVDLTRAQGELAARHGLTARVNVSGNGPACYWETASGGLIGFITPMSRPYCDGCSRFRLTAEGGLRPCLAYDRHIDLRPALRAGDEAIAACFREAAAVKPAGHHWRAGSVTQTRMAALGG